MRVGTPRTCCRKRWSRRGNVPAARPRRSALVVATIRRSAINLTRSSDRRARRQVRADSIHQEPAFAERVSRWFAEWWWLPAGATTVVVGGLILSLRAAPSVSTVANLAPQPVRHVYTPEQVDNYLVEARDLGVFVGSDNRPYKLVRATWVDEADYRAADGNSRMLVTDAREQLVPVALEVY